MCPLHVSVCVGHSTKYTRTPQTKHCLPIDYLNCIRAARSTSLANQLLMSPSSRDNSAAASTGPAHPLAADATGDISASEIPKSPPKWPLRPGVLAYVKGDTKQNICAARGTATMAVNQSMEKENGSTGQAAVVSPLNNSTAGNSVNADSLHRSLGSDSQSMVDGGLDDGQTVRAPGDRVLRKALKTIVLSDDVAIQVEEDDDDDDDEQEQDNRGAINRLAEDGEETNVDELLNFTNSNFINRILKRLRWKRRGAAGFENRRRCSPSSSGPKKAKKSRRRLLLLRKMPINGLFGSWKSTNSHTELFDSSRHRPKGIKYPSSGNWP